MSYHAASSTACDPLHEPSGVTEGRRFDRVGGSIGSGSGTWTYGARMRHRYGAANQSTTKESFEASGRASAERVREGRLAPEHVGASVAASERGYTRDMAEARQSLQAPVAGEPHSAELSEAQRVALETVFFGEQLAGELQQDVELAAAARDLRQAQPPAAAQETSE